jgi:hypothetical protein
MVPSVQSEAHSSGVCWAAVLAGAVVTAAVSLALLALGTGIGFSEGSPLASGGASVARIGRTAIAWLVLMQLIASAVGGYLAGRLRSRWVNIHTHEVYFRDTAHGFLAWAVSLVITAAFLTSAAASIGGGAARARMAARSDAASSGESADPNGYLVDTLLRSNAAASDHDNSSVRQELGRIFANALRAGSLPSADRSYLVRIVTAKSGASDAEAETRVDDAFVHAQDAADTARRAVAHAMYWMFLALLIGAFSASVAATVGGKERDRVVVI